MKNLRHVEANLLSRVICVAEDRRSCEPAVRLLVASLSRHCKGVAVQLFFPDPPNGFREWLKQYPSVNLNAHPVEGGWQKYDVKPQALFSLLKQGFQEVLWIDSDVLVCADFRLLFNVLGQDVLVLTEEALCSAHADPGGLRARLWGFKVGRVLPFLANTAIIRVTQAHVALLQRWMELLRDPAYRDAQQSPWDARPVHLMGDQEVLTAMLTSIEYSHVPLKFLKRGDQIIQYFGSSGYTVWERVKHLIYGMPPFVHSQGYKPWWPREEVSTGGLSARFNAIYKELTPYTYLARRYGDKLESRDWLELRTPLLRVSRALAFGQAPLFGILLAVIADIARLLKSVQNTRETRQWRGNPEQLEGPKNT
jgi:hypothetical protein